MTQEWIMWFQDGGGRTLIFGEEELKQTAIRFDFDADEVLRHGSTEFIDEDGHVDGGVYQA